MWLRPGIDEGQQRNASGDRMETRWQATRDLPETMSKTTCHEAALTYAGYGWSVVPVRPAAKFPLIRWQEFQERRADADEIAQWFERWPDANVGIVTGAISGLTVFDIDPRHKGDDSLATWEMLHGPLPPTIEAITGGGGRHLYFSTGSTGLRSRVAIARGIDVRARGGLVVAPPSRHPSGNLYRWRDGRAPSDAEAEPLRGWLAQILLGMEDRRGHPLSHWRDLVRGGVKEGERNNTIASLSGHLLWHDVDPEVVRELLLCWNSERCDPPLDDEEVTQVVASITRLHKRAESDT
jgi:hypothetical protein